ncbi:MAG: 2-keto-4-pentenoate hydratase, partial [Bacteroidota bacterium]
MTNQATIEQLALRLREAQIHRQPCAPIREVIGVEDIKAAYAIQDLNNQLRIDAGARVVGRKIGLTSKVVQQQLGVDQPDYGSLLHDMEVLNGDSLSVQEILQPKAEGEIAFVLGQDLNSDQLSTMDLLSAIDYVLAAIEIVGSRINNWNIKITDTIADNASASHFVLGHRPLPLKDIDLINCQMRMYKN